MKSRSIVEHSGFTTVEPDLTGVDHKDRDGGLDDSRLAEASCMWILLIHFYHCCEKRDESSRKSTRTPSPYIFLIPV